MGVQTTMRRLERYLDAGGQRLRLGYTTGTCAAAATRAAAELLLTGQVPAAINVDTPAGIECLIDVEESQRGTGWARAAVMKDAGDDPDVTDGVLVWALVRAQDKPGITIDGGEGVGRVTKAGLDQPVGAAAINSVPRAMIRAQAEEALREHGHEGGLSVEISIPEGLSLAERTFNPRLGIEGGISVLGTSGIVRPMSEDALVASIRLELKVLAAAGVRDVLLVPGNIGHDFAVEALGLSEDALVSFSNYLGMALDAAGELGFASALVVGHLGKLVKAAGGIMNLHSRVADCRMEILTAHAACAGASPALAAELMRAPTTDAAAELLDAQGLLKPTMASLADALERRLSLRAQPTLRVEAVVFSPARDVLCKTSGADELIALHGR